MHTGFRLVLKRVTLNAVIWAVINYFLVNYVIKLLWSSWLQKFNYSKVIGNWVVVKLLFKVVNYQVIKLLKCSWRSFCLPVDSYLFTYITGTVYLLITTVLLKWDRPTYIMTLWHGAPNVLIRPWFNYYKVIEKVIVVKLLFE